MKKLKIDVSDFENLSFHSKQVVKFLLENYPPKNKDDANIGQSEFVFPLKWKVEILGSVFEWVVSEMGSVTLRLAEHPRYSRNPPPIFYVSLGKYEAAEFLWEDPEGNPIDLFSESGKTLILDKVKLYLESQS
ncbi:hypothetical protein LPTSP3_g29180 [Leptospira kobayashii]|uniref:Uncharacterized protein n=1 Tax=Leptospira kobayashii TaxID=1917830 RepID=A0ABM7ULV0_9LEPT|nr:hypothetical protein [Leptospira kobayashii]BDA79988.1 hypothetical protein LPTSP3_g29180 [Leptospira kobayashii]